MSRAPRPHRYPSMMSPPNGRWRQSWLTVVTTSTWPCSSSGGASPRPFTRATRLGRPGSLSYRANSIWASRSSTSMSSTARCSSPGGLVVSSRMRSRASSTTNGIVATEIRLADRGLLESADDRRLQERVAIETRVRFTDAIDLGPDLVQEHRMLQSLHRLIRHAMLPRAQQLPHPPDSHVLLGELETVVDLSHQMQSLETRVRRIVRQQQAVALGRAAPDPASKLVQLRQPEAVGALDHHDSGIGHVHADLDNGGCDQDLDLAGDKTPHDIVFLF